MNYEIVSLDEFSGCKATIYSILPEGSEYTFFDVFVEDYRSNFSTELVSIADLLEDMGNKFGVRENFVKLNEGKPGDGIVALYDNPDKHLRLYGIRFGSGIIILGSGGEKKSRAWQDDTKLEQEVNMLMNISAAINERIKEKEITFSIDGTYLLGNLNFYNYE